MVYAKKCPLGRVFRFSALFYLLYDSKKQFYFSVKWRTETSKVLLESDFLAF